MCPELGSGDFPDLFYPLCLTAFEDRETVSSTSFNLPKSTLSPYVRSATFGNGAAIGTTVTYTCGEPVKA